MHGNGLLLEHLSWRWMFVINVPVCAAALLLAVRLLPADTGRRPDTELDTPGLIMLSPGLAALVYALAQASEGGAPGDPRVPASRGWTPRPSSAPAVRDPPDGRASPAPRA